MKSRVKRMWIHADSKYDPYHKWNGTNVLAEFLEDEVRVFFLSGPVISMRCHKRYLSEGWRQPY